MLLRKLISIYLRTGPFVDGRLYRAIGMSAIYYYQKVLRKAYSSRQCQFKVSCSRFLQEQLKNAENFEEIAVAMNTRMDDCSKPLRVVYSFTHGLSATGVTGRKYSQGELSGELISDFEKRLPKSIT